MASQVKQGYKQTEVGLIPEHWELIHLKDLVKQSHPITYGVLKPGDFYSDGIPLLQIQDILHKKIDVSKLHKISSKLDSQYSRTKLSGGEIVVSLVGTIGRFALIPHYLSGANLHRNLAKISIDPKKAFSQYVYHYLLSEEVKNAISLNTFGSTQALFNLSDLRHLTIILPPIAEQEKIAEALSDVDSLIESLEELIAKKRNIKQGAMQELLTGKRRLIDNNGKWEIKKLEDIADVIDPHPSHRAPTVVKYGIPFVGIGDLDEQGNLIGKDIRQVNQSIFEEHLTRYDFKDELIGLGRVASIGKVVKLRLLQQKYAISPTLGIIRGRKVKRDYLFYVLKSNFVSNQFNQIMSGSTRSSVGMIVLRKLDIFLPPTKAEQEAIAEVLTDMDKEITALEEKLNKTRQLKQGMMQELLTGKTRLI